MAKYDNHASPQYDKELDALRTRALEMGGLVETQMIAALGCFFNHDPEKTESIIQTDHRINGMEVRLDEACARIIARRQPTASDLRLVLAVSKSVTDLERIGDEAAKIARHSRDIHERGRQGVPCRGDVQDMGEIAIKQVRRALDALARLDVEDADKMIGDDRSIDDKFNAIMRQLITFVMEDPRTISAALDVVLIAKAIERMGDHAKNIAEYVIYIVKGTDVRHIEVDHGNS